MYEFRALLERRIVLLDCAMGTMIQSYGLSEGDYRGKRFADHPGELKGNNDLLSITQPGIISDIHEAAMDAGSDIIETNTFSATAFCRSCGRVRADRSTAQGGVETAFSSRGAREAPAGARAPERRP